MTWNAADLRQNKKKSSVLDAPDAALPPEPPSPKRTPRMELAEQAELWMAEQTPEHFPLLYRRELREMGLVDARTARNLRWLMLRGIEPL